MRAGFLFPGPVESLLSKGGWQQKTASVVDGSRVLAFSGAGPLRNSEQSTAIPGIRGEDPKQKRKQGFGIFRCCSKGTPSNLYRE